MNLCKSMRLQISYLFIHDTILSINGTTLTKDNLRGHTTENTIMSLEVGIIIYYQQMFCMSLGKISETTTSSQYVAKEI